jgi:hypothetical protein
MKDHIRQQLGELQPIYQHLELQVDMKDFWIGVKAYLKKHLL